MLWKGMVVKKKEEEEMMKEISPANTFP